VLFAQLVGLGKRRMSRTGGNATRTSGAVLALSDQGFEVSRGGVEP
jgi:hypothetical protein